MPIATITDVRLVERRIHLPDCCPKCGASFTDPAHANLTEWDWTRVQFQGHWHRHPSRNDSYFDVSEERERSDDFYPCLFECRICDTIVADARIDMGRFPALSRLRWTLYFAFHRLRWRFSADARS